MPSMDAYSCVNDHPIKLVNIRFLVPLLIAPVNIVTNKSSQVEPLWELNKFIYFPSLMVKPHVLDDKNSWWLFNCDSFLRIRVALTCMAVVLVLPVEYFSFAEILEALLKVCFCICL